MDSTLAFLSNNFEKFSAYFQRIPVASKRKRGTASIYSNREFATSRGTLVAESHSNGSFSLLRYPPRMKEEYILENP